MRQNLAIILICVFAIFCLSSCQGKQQIAEKPYEEQEMMTIEKITDEVNLQYNQAIKSGMSKEDAMNKVIDFLKAQKNVKEVKVKGSDSLQVFFTDGNDLLMLLGTDRL